MWHLHRYRNIIQEKREGINDLSTTISSKLAVPLISWDLIVRRYRCIYFGKGVIFLGMKGFLRKEIQCFSGACPFEKGDLGNAGKRGEDNFNQRKNLTAFPFVLRSCP